MKICVDYLITAGTFALPNTRRGTKIEVKKIERFHFGILCE